MNLMCLLSDISAIFSKTFGVQGSVVYGSESLRSFGRLRPQNLIKENNYEKLEDGSYAFNLEYCGDHKPFNILVARDKDSLVFKLGGY